MAYSALTSLKQTLEDLMNCELCFTFGLQTQFKALSTNVSVVQDLLQNSFVNGSDYNERKHLERWIRHSANKAQDLIEEFVYICAEASDLTSIFDEEYNMDCSLINISEEINSIKMRLNKHYQMRNAPVDVLQSTGDFSAEHSWRWRSNPEETVVGIDDDLVRIGDRLIGPKSKMDIVTIVGMGGIGKTTLGRSIFYDLRIEKHFHKRAWITVTQNYQVRDIFLGILSSVTELTDEMSRRSNEDLEEFLYKTLKGQRYLIVLDDVWTKKCWNDFKRCFPDDKIGSRIILTTRDADVAVYANPENYPHYMGLLSIDKSWELLHKKVFLKERCPPHLEDIGREIAEKCQGLPLGILAIAGYLSNISRTQASWMSVAKAVRSLVSRNEEKCLDILALSYDFLPYHLKACFLYMGAFPNNFEIPVWRLIRLWIAEGILRAECSKTLEEVAELCLEDLIGRSLIMVRKRKPDGGIKGCGIHDLVRDLILKEAKKEDFLHVFDVFHKTSYNKRRLSIHYAKNSQTHLHYSSPSTTHSILHSGRVLSKHSFFRIGGVQFDKFQDMLDLHTNSNHNFHLKPSVLRNRSILCFGSQILESHSLSSNLVFAVFKLLRVLDVLDHKSFEEFPVEITQLVHLRYLALSTPTYFPAILSKLWNLQTLVNEHNRGHVNLPSDIWMMPQMRHLHIKHSGHFPHPLRATKYGNRLSILSNLQTLSALSVLSCTEEFFSSVPSLKKLKLFATVKESLQAQICLHHLVYLTELKNLKCVFFGIGKLPHWDAFPPSLRKLTLNGCFLPWHDTEILSMLPNLEVLKLKDYAFKGPCWELAEDGFCVLKYLLIERTDLEDWGATSIPFPCLQQLILRRCLKLKEIPPVIGEILTLQVIDLDDCSPSAVSSARHIQQAQWDIGNEDLFVRVQQEQQDMGLEDLSARANSW